jgi:phosphoribosylglycinamide formyltransferase-1
LCVLASGRGSDLRAIIKASKTGLIRSRVKLVISNNSKSGALKIAKSNKIPACHLSHIMFSSNELFVKEFLRLLEKYKIDLIALAGYMKMIEPSIIKKFRNRIINIHPALLPKYGGKGMYGIHVHEAVINSGDEVTGVSVHYADEVYDHGKIILQKQVKVKPGDTPETLRKRVLRTEHKVYPEAIRLLEMRERQKTK